MGRQDIATRRFFENNRYFADAVNGYLYQGKRTRYGAFTGFHKLSSD